jgi:hypothetical protein
MRKFYLVVLLFLRRKLQQIILFGGRLSGNVRSLSQKSQKSGRQLTIPCTFSSTYRTFADSAKVSVSDNLHVSELEPQKGLKWIRRNTCLIIKHAINLAAIGLVLQYPFIFIKICYCGRTTSAGATGSTLIRVVRKSVTVSVMLKVSEGESCRSSNLKVKAVITIVHST